MIGLIGIKKNTPLEIREKFSITNKVKEEAIDLLKKEFNEIIILSTCNRLEIYFECDKEENNIIDILFEILKFDVSLKEYVFIGLEDRAIVHLFEVVCGFHSKILGEDQILGQIKDSFTYSLEKALVGDKLLRLFQLAITCGKRFRKEAKLYEIPVSSASISVCEVLKKENKKIMVLGYGTIGKLVVKALMSHRGLEKIYIVVRDKKKVNLIDKNIEVLNFTEKNKIINDVDGIISCTSAPHIVIREEDIKREGKLIEIYDLAIPRDVDERLYDYKRLKILNIDNVSKIDDKNKALRREKMESFKWIIDKYIKEYREWIKFRKIAPFIKEAREKKSLEAEKRYDTYKSKNKEENKIAEKMINSMGNLYLNRAIEVLKEESLKGREGECLEIMRKIFL